MLERLPGRERPLGQPLIQRLPAGQFPDEVGHGQAVGQHGLPEVVHPDDARVRKLQRGPMIAERERLTGQGALSPLAIAFRRGELRLEAELRWHDEFGQQIAVALPKAAPALRAVAGGPDRPRTQGDA